MRGFEGRLDISANINGSYAVKLHREIARL